MPLIPHNECFERSFSPGAEIRPEGWSAGGRNPGWIRGGGPPGWHARGGSAAGTHHYGWGWMGSTPQAAIPPRLLRSNRSSDLLRSRDRRALPPLAQARTSPKNPWGEVELQRAAGGLVPPARASDRGAQDNAERGGGHGLDSPPRRSGQRNRVLQPDEAGGCRRGRVPGAHRLFQRPLRGAPHPSPLPQTARERETILHLAGQAAGPDGARPGSAAATNARRSNTPSPTQFVGEGG